jgi:hypothetical protein
VLVESLVAVRAYAAVRLDEIDRLLLCRKGRHLSILFVCLILLIWLVGWFGWLVWLFVTGFAF